MARACYSLIYAVRNNGLDCESNGIRNVFYIIRAYERGKEEAGSYEYNRFLYTNK